MSTPTTPYRTEIDALRERKTTLEAEIARLREQTKELASLEARQAELANELAAVDGRLRDGGAPAKRALPMLDNVRVASPCNASWDDMLGDDRVRFCLKCDKNVFNLSAMTRDAAEALLQERLAGELCVRFYQRADGTLLTQDCPVGVTKKRRKKLAIVAASAGAMALAATAFASRTQGPKCLTATMGDVAPLATPTPIDPTDPTPLTQGQVADPAIMGSIATPSPPPPTHAVKMGRQAPTK